MKPQFQNQSDNRLLRQKRLRNPQPTSFVRRELHQLKFVIQRIFVDVPSPLIIGFFLFNICHLLLDFSNRNRGKKYCFSASSFFFAFQLLVLSPNESNPLQRRWQTMADENGTSTVCPPFVLLQVSEVDNYPAAVSGSTIANDIQMEDGNRMYANIMIPTNK